MELVRTAKDDNVPGGSWYKHPLGITVFLPGCLARDGDFLMWLEWWVHENWAKFMDVLRHV